MNRMLRPFAALLALLLLVPGLPAAATAKPAARGVAHAVTTAARPALWRVVRGKTTIWLFGTVHLMTKGVDWYRGPVATAFEHSDTLVTEIIEKDPATMKQLLASRAMLPDGQSLRESLMPDDRAKLEAAMADNAIPAAAFDRFQPWFAAISLVNYPLLKAGYDPANGIDAVLAHGAEAEHKGHEALETPEFQFELFASLPAEAQKRYLMQVVGQLPSLQVQMRKIMRAWQAGQAETIARLMNDKDDDPALRQTLLLDRNKAWARWIKLRLDKAAQPGTAPETVFIAVGAGHLAGRGSVQEDLRKLGIGSARVQ